MTTQSTQQTDSEELVWVRMHSSTLVGVSLPGGGTINPGDVKAVPRAIAHKLVHTNRAVFVDGPGPG